MSTITPQPSGRGVIATGEPPGFNGLLGGRIGQGNDDEGRGALAKNEKPFGHPGSDPSATGCRQISSGDSSGECCDLCCFRSLSFVGPR